MPLVAALLLLQPFLAEPADVRMVAAGVGQADVEWTVDGAVAATTHDRQASQIHLDAGSHRITAESSAAQAWTAAVRPMPGAAGMTYVPSWSASAPGEVPRAIPAQALTAAALVAAAYLVRRHAHSKGP